MLILTNSRKLEKIIRSAGFFVEIHSSLHEILNSNQLHNEFDAVVVHIDPLFGAEAPIHFRRAGYNAPIIGVTKQPIFHRSVRDYFIKSGGSDIVAMCSPRDIVTLLRAQLGVTSVSTRATLRSAVP